MSLRPIDMQVTIPRSSEVSRLNNLDPQRADTANQHFTQQLDKEIKQSQQQVTSTKQNEKGKVDKDGSNKNGGGGSGRKKKENGKNGGQTQNVPGSGSILDIRV